MKSTFFSKLVNNPFQDPILYVRFRREKDAVMFDCGDVYGLSVREIQKISDIFVTHMHVDHFIGFDNVLRCLLNREAPLHIYGPRGIINAVAHKLKGYTWNLIKEYPLKIEVCEVHKDVILRGSFYATEGFNKIDGPVTAFDKIIMIKEGLTVEADVFDHGIEVLGFSLHEDTQININKALLLERGLTPGAWLNELKAAIRNDIKDLRLRVDGHYYHIEELCGLAMITRGQKIAYITDISPSEANIKKAIGLAAGADTLYIEAFFLAEDVERAHKRNHLTTAHTGHIARCANVINVEITHVSPKYITMYERIKLEVKEGYPPCGSLRAAPSMS
ncbi:MAG: ribonuclease Z [Nitrospirae bacterium]|nr:ribonuclease Z [Nitrospirota bacterium]